MTTFSPTGTGRTGSTQDYTVPITDNYEILAVGAAGGFAHLLSTSTVNPGGAGTSMLGVFALTAGDVIRFMVGQEGLPPSANLNQRGGGGGGATFVYNVTTSTLLMVAGGGGGAGQYVTTTKNANLTANGSAGTGGSAGAGGTAPNGGLATSYSGGGGGYSGNGAASSYGGGGLSYTNGGAGGLKYSDGGDGGYGGGGGSYAGSGGGGGYGGGGAGGWSYAGDGGGGGSFNGGTSQTNTAGVGTTQGSAQIAVYNDAPLAPTILTPAENATVALTSGVDLTYIYSDPTPDAQVGYALKRRAVTLGEGGPIYADQPVVEEATYNAIGESNSTGLTVYKQVGAVSTKIPDPDVLQGYVNGVAWSTGSKFLAVASQLSPYFAWYKRDGDALTKLPVPATALPGTGYGVSWSPDARYLSVVHNASPFVTVYKRSGETLTKLSDPSVLPTGYGRSTAWSPDGEFLAVGHGTSPFLTVYQRSGDTLTKLSNPATTPSGIGNGVAWSPDGIYLAAANSFSPFITIYKRSGTTLTKLSNPATLPANSGQAVAFSPDGNYLAFMHNLSPFMIVYKRSGDVFTAIANPAILPSGTTRGCSWSPDGNYLSMATTSSPYVNIYSRSGDVLTRLSNPATLPAAPGLSAAYGDVVTPGVEWWDGADWISSEIEVASATQPISTTGWPVSGDTYQYALANSDVFNLGPYSAWRTLNPYEWWNGTAWVPMAENWVVSSTSEVTLSAIQNNLDGAFDYDWTVATKDAAGLVGPYASMFEFIATQVSLARIWDGSAWLDHEVLIRITSSVWAVHNTLIWDGSAWVNY